MSTISSPRAQASGDGGKAQTPGGGVRVTSPWPDFFTTNSIAEAISLLVPPQQFLLDNFFGNERFFGGRFLTVDTKRQRRVLAPVVSRYNPGVVVERPVVQTQSYDVPKIAPYRVLNLAQLDARAPGGFPTGSDAGQYAAYLIADDSGELQSLIQRRTELYASQILFTGKVRYRLDGGEFEEFGYGPNVPTVYNPPVVWDDPAATPITDLKKVRSQIIRDTGLAPDIVVFSDQTADAFTNNAQVLEQLNKLHHITGQIAPARPAGTSQYLGKLLLPSLEMWAYSETFLSEEDGVTPVPFVPAHCALVGTTNPSGFAYYGSILQLDEAGFQEAFQAKFVPRMMYDLKNETAEIRLQSRPALVPVDCASWTVLNCLPAPTPHKRKNGVAIPAEESQPPSPRPLPRKG